MPAQAKPRQLVGYTTNQEFQIFTFLQLWFGTYDEIPVSNTKMKKAARISVISVLTVVLVIGAHKFLSQYTSRYFDTPNAQLTVKAKKQQGCRYTKSHSDLAGYDNGGPYILDHFRLTKGRTDLREFLWTHWHDHKKAVAEVRAGTVDRGTVKVLYMIQPDAKGQWGIDVELDRPMDPPCVAFHADSLVRVPIAKPAEDYPSQTLGLWPPDKLPERLLSDSDVRDAKLFRVILVRERKAVSDEI